MSPNSPPSLLTENGQDALFTEGYDSDGESLIFVGTDDEFLMDMYNEEAVVAQSNEQATSEEGVARTTIKPVVVLILKEDIKK